MCYRGVTSTFPGDSESVEKFPQSPEVLPFVSLSLRERSVVDSVPELRECTVDEQTKKMDIKFVSSLVCDQ